MWKEELVELLSWAHADVGLMWGRTDSSERGKVGNCRYYVQGVAHNLLTLAC